MRTRGLASYDATGRIVQLLRASGVPPFGCVGNERYREFASSGWSDK